MGVAWDLLFLNHLTEAHPVPMIAPTHTPRHCRCATPVTPHSPCPPPGFQYSHNLKALDNPKLRNACVRHFSGSRKPWEDLGKFTSYNTRPLWGEMWRPYSRPCCVQQATDHMTAGAVGCANVAPAPAVQKSS